MDQNPQNQNNNNDLDSLLKEFQNLSTPEEEVISTPLEVNTVNNVISELPIVSNEPVDVNINPIPVMETVIEKSIPDQPQVSEQIQQPVDMVPNLEPVSTNKIGIEPVINPETVVKEVEVDHVPTVQSPNEDTGNDSKASLPNPSNKGNLIFMVGIFLIIALFIFYIPKIDEMLENKPGAEPKPTATPVATATPKPVAKEINTDCTVEDAISGAVTTKTMYSYSSLSDKILSTTKTVTTSFANIEGDNLVLYNQTKLTCNSLATTYAGVSGYTVSCEEKGNAFTVTYKFDLATFTNPTTITLNGKAEVITSDVKLNDSLKGVKTNMTSLGATCK